MYSVPGRVAHLSTAHPARDNRIFHKECRALQEAGLDVWLVVPQDGHETVGGVHIYGLPRRSTRLKRVVVGQLDAWRALSVVRPSLVHFHDPELIPLVLVWKTLRKCAAVYDAHEDLEKQIESKPYLPKWTQVIARTLARVLTGLADRQMDGIVSATPPISLHFKNPRRAVVHNYPWISEYPWLPDRNPEAGTAVYVGGMSEARGFSMMINLVENIPDARLILAGRMDRNVTQAYSKLPDDPDIEYLGELSARSVPEVIARGSVGFVLLKRLPNYVESLPTKLFEYMASGVPFVATDFEYWRNILEELDCGVFVDVDDPRACASALEKLLSDPDRCIAMGRRGRDGVIDRFNFDREAVALVSFTRSLLGVGFESSWTRASDEKSERNRGLS